jgi:TolA-binding protein
MQRKSLRNRLLAAAAIVLLLTAASSPARAVSKETIELQTQVQQLLDMVQRLQSTVDTRFALMQHLVEQTADNANQTNAAVTALQQKIAAQSDAAAGKQDAASAQMQALNDSVDELKSRIAKLDKSIQDLQTQLQSAQNPASSQPGAAPVAPGVAPGAAPVPSPNGAVPATAPSSVAPPIAAVPADQAPPLAGTFQAGLRDFNSAKYDLASGEFQDVVHYYPMDEQAGSAHFYLGEIDARQSRLTEAVKEYNAVLEGFPGNSKSPAAQYHKGLALLQLKQKQAGINELRSLIKRHPASPEAALARKDLAKLTASAR